MTTPEDPKKRGRKTLGDVSMSVVERKRRSRASKLASGFREFTVVLPDVALESISTYAGLAQVTKAVAVQQVLHAGLQQVLNQRQFMIASDVDMAAHWRQLNESIQNFKWPAGAKGGEQKKS